jgi:hypothetical protein
MYVQRPPNFEGKNKNTLAFPMKNTGQQNILLHLQKKENQKIKGHENK